MFERNMTAACSSNRQSPTTRFALAPGPRTDAATLAGSGAPLLARAKRVSAKSQVVVLWIAAKRAPFNRPLLSGTSPPGSGPFGGGADGDGFLPQPVRPGRTPRNAAST